MLAVSNLLYGMEIDHYVSLTMDGVALLNDLVGGVTVEVLDDFSGIDDSLMQGETVTLQGQQALTYVRSRGGLEDSSNLHRMERQRQYLSALQQQLKAAVQQEDGFTLDALLQLNEYMVSDCTVDQLSELGNSLAAYQVNDILTTPGDAQEGRSSWSSLWTKMPPTAGHGRVLRARGRILRQRRDCMKIRWLLLSLALVAVAAVAAVVFSSQGSEASNGLSKGILYQLMEFFGIEITAESVKTGNFLIRKAAHFTVYFVLGLGLTGAFHFQKKVPAWIPSLLWGQPLPPPMSSISPLQAVQHGRGVVLDSCGVAAGCLVSSFLWRRGKKKRG